MLAEPSFATFTLLLILLLLVVRFVHSHITTVSRERHAILSSRCSPPRSIVPVRDPIIGLDFIYDVLLSLGQPPAEAIRDGLDWFRAHGPTYAIYRWSWRTVTTCDPKNIQHMLATAFKDFELPQLRTEAMGGLFGQGIFVMPRHVWGPARALLRPSFTTQNMEPLAGIVETHFRSFVENVPKDGRTVVDLQPLFFGLTMDTATEFLMGTSTNMLERSLGGKRKRKQDDDHDDDMNAEQFVNDYFTCCVEAVTYMQMGPLGRLRVNVGAWRAKRRIERYVDRFVERALGVARGEEKRSSDVVVGGYIPEITADGADSDDSSDDETVRSDDGSLDERGSDAGSVSSVEEDDNDTLHEAAKPNHPHHHQVTTTTPTTTTTATATTTTKPTYNLVQELARSTQDRDVLRHQILHILLAGRDTTASLLSNFFFVLARDARVWAKLRAEIDEKLQGGRRPTQEDLNEMTYLKWCYKEALRLYPVVPTNARDAAVDTTLPRGGGPDGDQPMFVRKGTPVMYSVYAMHRDTSVYGADAAEFRPERWEKIRPGWAYLPFNGGPRICLGQKFAFIEACYVTVRMIQTFDRIEPRDETRWTELYTLAMCSRNGLKVAVTPRESAV